MEQERFVSNPESTEFFLSADLLSRLELGRFSAVSSRLEDLVFRLKGLGLSRGLRKSVNPELFGSLLKFNLVGFIPAVGREMRDVFCSYEGVVDIEGGE